ncbi:MAG: ABC transporter permease, partial [Pseudomonadota bacterium]
MTRSPLSYFVGEALYEMRMAMRSLVVPLVFVGLAAYMVLIFLNADYMRTMGALDIYRNSAHLSYLMASGQSLWLYFAWAWLFAQIVLRDRNAQLHEVVLAAPVPLHLTLLARFTGALVIAVAMGAAIFVGFLLAPVLVTLGALPAEAVGPQPWAAFGWSMLVFTLPNALATGAVFLCAAIWTRSTAGPFSAAAGFALVWMVAMIVLRGGDVDVSAASVLDPSGYSEAERQSFAWTPTEKKTAIIALSDLLIYNRLLWTVLPCALLAFVLMRLRREQLAIGGQNKALDVAPQDQVETGRAAPAATLLPPITEPRWPVALWQEYRWQLRASMSGFGLRLALLMLLLSGTLGAWVNFVGHVDGPLVPTPQGLMPFLSEFFYLVLIFVVVGFVGVLMRRDDVLGYDEWVDVMPAPLAVPLLAKALAALTLVALLCMVPALSAMLVTAFGAPQSLDVGYPFTYMFLTFFPGLAEIGAAAFLAHALFRNAGPAYVVSVLVGFVAIVNHELSLVEYPPAQFGLPSEATPSELVGWGPWLPLVFTMAAWKWAIIVLVIGLTWLLWRRGAALTLGDRVRALGSRLAGPAGLVSAAAVGAMVLIGGLLNRQLTEQGEFESTASSLAGDAQWEQAWWSRGAPFTVAGGSIAIQLQPDARSGSVTWELEGLQAEALHGTLPHGIELQQVERDGRAQTVEVDGDHFALALPGCDEGCDLTLQLSIGAQGWPVETAPWLHRSGVWLRAETVLPLLGHDPHRLVRSLADRTRNGLSEDLPPMLQAAALAPLQGVAPLGAWRWQIEAPDGEAVGATGSTDGMLDFAYAWLPPAAAPGTTAAAVDGLSALTASTRGTQLGGIRTELNALGDCVGDELGTPA